MKVEVSWSPAAQQDLDRILEYLHQKWTNKVVEKFLNKTEKAINLIEIDPNIFPIIEHDLGIRKCVLTKQNTLFYRYRNQNIEIIRLFDTRQKPKSLNFE